jgi:ATP-dependent Lhr-like helicase
MVRVHSCVTRPACSGRSWRVTSVDWKRRIVWIEPAAQRGRARWTGGARSLSGDICSATRRALGIGPGETVTLSQRGVARLEELREEIAIGTDGPVIQLGESSGRFRVWTFAGKRANRQLARRFFARVGVLGFDEYGINCKVDPAQVTIPATLAVPDLTPVHVERFVSGIKFAECLPERLRFHVVASRFFN